jgi:deoxyadenosine/deoxycytidine kinase
MNKIISIEGNIGSGKSTLINKLQESLKEKPLIFLDEPVSEWMEIKDDNGEHILSKFYKNQDKYSFPFQMMAYISRLNKLKNALIEKKTILTERSLSTDKYVFAQMLHDTKKIDTYEYQIYNKWFDSFNQETEITHIIYIKTDPTVCYNRVQERSRSGENNIEQDYLNDCHKYHESMIETQRNKNIEILSLDGNLNIHDNNILSEWIDSINKFISD